MDTHKNIEERIKPSPKYLRWFFFISGIIATIAYRIIFLLDPRWEKIVWYIGTIGFIVYFGHRTQIETKRAEIVKDFQLIDTIAKSDVAPEKKAALSYLLKTSVTSKARFNSAFILIASIIALILDLAINVYHIF